jgi:hypothetical protein
MMTKPQRYLALYYCRDTGEERVMDFPMDSRVTYWELISEPQRVIFKPRLLVETRAAVMALDQQIREHLEKVQYLQKQRVAVLKGEQT